MIEDQPSPSPYQTREELRELVQSQLQALLERENLEGAKALLVPVQPVDIAAVIAELPIQMQAIAFRLLSKDEAIEVYEYLESSVQQALIKEFKHQDVLDIVDKMSPDDRARLFDELPAKVVRRLLNQLSPTEREATTLLLGYQPGTAGRIMTTEYIALKESSTVAQALERVRSLANVKETIYYLYIIDASRLLTGVLTLRGLLTADSEQIVSAIAKREVIFVHTNTDQEEVARIVRDYDFGAVPVVDSEQRLVGIITIDDVLDVIEQETTEDIYTLVGCNPEAINTSKQTICCKLPASELFGCSFSSLPILLPVLSLLVKKRLSNRLLPWLPLFLCSLTLGAMWGHSPLQ
nr:magnesium transporter [Pleurocapsa sp. PCC 7327]